MNSKKIAQGELWGTTALSGIMVDVISGKITPSAANTKAKQDGGFAHDDFYGWAARRART